MMKFVLSMLRESLFATSHDETDLRFSFTDNSRADRLLFVQNRFVSSAKMWKLKKELHLLKSLIYYRNRRGPSTDPCGTP